ncbi:unnamed protein product [Nippostrongylus brasiliensis]|uniref:Overexpressed in colon carcinoma 1 protein n=1 Tax=Nippostrongylus brasiliensis TaxID=27835 RepID=A0A0N4XG57_NIPBR|nr:unnamed protein product [Nippostrongylus brasiliensis]
MSLPIVAESCSNINGLLNSHSGALIPVELSCVARGKPRRYGLVCLPSKEDLDKIRNRHKNGPVIITQDPRDPDLEMDTNGKDHQVRFCIYFFTFSGFSVWSYASMFCCLCTLWTTD